MDRSGQFVYVGFWTRVQAAFLDALIGLAFLPLHFWMGPWGATHRTVVLDVAFYVAWTAFYIFTVIRFGGTPGKLIVGIRIVDSHGCYLRIGRAVRRELFPNLLYSILGVLQAWVAYSRFPESEPHETFLEVGRLVAEYGHPISDIAGVMSFAVLADIGLILFNAKKRAIHDFIAGSYVITKDSYQNHQEAAMTPDATGCA